MKFTIIRDKWYRGQGGEKSKLRMPDGQQCCLGFFAEACGVEHFVVWGLSLPAAYPNELAERDKLPDNMLSLASTFDFVATNDDPELGAVERERELTRMFADKGIEVEFK